MLENKIKIAELTLFNNYLLFIKKKNIHLLFITNIKSTNHVRSTENIFLST